MKVQYQLVDNFIYSIITIIEHDLGEGVEIYSSPKNKRIVKGYVNTKHKNCKHK